VSAFLTKASPLGEASTTSGAYRRGDNILGTAGHGAPWACRRLTAVTDDHRAVNAATVPFVAGPWRRLDARLLRLRTQGTAAMPVY
jgi:hypothetical protein